MAAAEDHPQGTVAMAVQAQRLAAAVAAAAVVQTAQQAALAATVDAGKLD